MKGDDTLQGGDGADVFVFRAGDGDDTIADFQSGDTIRIYGFSGDFKALDIEQDGADAVVGYGDSGDTLRLTGVLATSLRADDFTLVAEEEGAPSGGTASEFVAYGAGVRDSDPDTQTQQQAPVGRALTGTDGDDTLAGTDGDDTLDGGAGDDTLYGYGGDDTLRGGVGNDVLEGGKGADIFEFAPGDGHDTIKDFEVGVDKIRLDAEFTNHNHGTGLANWQEGEDLVIEFTYYPNSAGTTTLTLTLKGVSLDPEKDREEQLMQIILYADYTGYGTDGHDKLYGSLGNDTLYGGKGNDYMSAWQGDDIFHGGPGADTMSGGYGVDWAFYTSSTAGVQVNLSTGRGRGGDAEGDKLSGIENLSGSAHADVLTGDGRDNTLHGNAGDDTLDGGAGDDTLRGGAGNDTFVFRTGYGEDTIGGSDTIEDFTAGDTISITSVIRMTNGVSDGFEALDFDALVIEQDGADTVISYGTHGDKIRLTGVTATSLRSDDFTLNVLYQNIVRGDGTLTGTDGDDIIEGGRGNDTLYGGKGDDTMEGNGGDDTFVFEAGDGSDTIEDFGYHGQADTIRFKGVTGGFDALDIKQDGNDVIVGYGDKGDTITLLWVSVDSLSADDFSFVA